jgi:hypothetical protein
MLCAVMASKVLVNAFWLASADSLTPYGLKPGGVGYLVTSMVPVLGAGVPRTLTMLSNAVMTKKRVDIIFGLGRESGRLFRLTGWHWPWITHAHG